MAISAAGFGVGGALWGLEAYRGTVGSDEVFTNPFSYILGAVAMAVFGGLALSTMFHRHTMEGGLINISISDARNCLSNKLFWKILILGTLGWLVAFLLPAVWAYELFLFGGQITIIFEFFASGETIDKLFSLQPYLGVAYLWLEFLLAGAILGLVYSLIFKTKILKAVLWSAGGFALASIAGPILGNLIGDLFGSLLVSYLITFLVIGVSFGLFLELGIYRKTGGVSGSG